ncbi:MAG: YceI family protein [Gemmatimonadales bacterium]|nr:YceI family protein [Gemmatimonadales bacterium]
MRTLVVSRRLALAALLVPALLPAQQQFTKAKAGTSWAIDTEHSEVTFRIRHMMGRVRGRFNDWSGTVVTDGRDWSRGTVNVRIQVKSIDTGNPARDNDLRSERFFWEAKHPLITFESTGILATDSEIEMGGLLTMRGVTKRVTLKGQYRGIAKGPDGRERVAFDGVTLVNRKDFGLTWNQVLESGAMIGDVVEIEMAIEAVKQG